MPFGFPPAPADNDPHPTVNPTFRYNAAAVAWLPIAGASGGSTPVTDALTTAQGTDRVIAFRNVLGADTPYQMALSTIQTYVTGAPSAPAVMVVGEWTLAAIAGGLRFGIVTAPAGSPTSYQYSTNNGSTWTTLANGSALGTRDILGLSETPYSCRVRAVNAVGPAPDPGSDTKTATPLAGGVTYIEFLTLSGMTEGGSAGASRTYTGSVTNGVAGGANWNLAIGSAGGFVTDFTPNGATPVAGLYTQAAGAWDANVHIVAYPAGASWQCEGGPTFTNLVTSAQTYTAGDAVRIRYSDTGNTYFVEIARASDPATWIVLSTGTFARSGPLYPRLASFGAAGAVFAAPRAYP